MDDSGLDANERNQEPRGFVRLGVRYAFSEEWVMSLNVDYYIRVNGRDNIGKVNVVSPRIGFAHRF